MKNTYHPFRVPLADARKAMQLSQAELGRKLGWPQSHISKIERGLVDPHASNLLEMARVLGFELLLVPKRLLPVVKIVLRGELPQTLSLPEALLRENKEGDET